ncbi:metallophosphoesterase family protein [Bradyrhizobium sp. USDA 4520]
MIAEVLDRDFVLKQLEIVRDFLGGGGRRGGDVDTPPVQVSDDDLKAAAAEIDRSLAAEAAAPSGPRASDIPPSGRRGDDPSPLANRAFISSDPVLSITQSALERYIAHKNASTVDQPGTGRRGDGGDQTDPVTGTRINRRIFDQFSVTDPGWVSSLIAMGIQKFKNPRAFNATSAPALEMKDRCRLVIVGDWGSGLPRAQATAVAMRKYVDECLASDIDCHVIHLGDVYYSGWDFEYQERFLPYWPVHKSEQTRIGSWSLNGNHDMYSGGYGYYDTLLADPRFAKQAKSSFFRLYNKNWQILGLDTAYDDNGLRDPQAKWVEDTVGANQQKTMLLSHHQFFSAYEPSDTVGAVLRTKLKRVLDSGRIDAALWGHEHRCIAYSSHGKVRYPRLIGHGGVPVYMTHAEADPYVEPATFEDRRFIGNWPEKWAYMGFAVLDFAGPALTTRYIDETGFQTKQEQFS